MRIAIDWKERGRELVLIGVVGAFLTVIDPYGATSKLPWWAAFLYWTGLGLLGSWTAEATIALLRRPGWDLPAAIVLPLVSITAAITVTLCLVGLDAFLNGRIMPLRYMPRLFGLVWVLAAAMTGIGYLVERAKIGAPPDPVQGAGPAETFLSRLPVKYRTADLYAVSSEDHYLRVHTSFGQELILMRLADAIRELAGADGLQVHRSWWVAKGAVKDTRRQGGKLSLVLESGVVVPVSRTFLPKVRAAGLAG